MKMEFKTGQPVYYIQSNTVVESVVRIAQYREYHEGFDEARHGSRENIYNDRMPITLRTAGEMYHVSGRWFRGHELFHSQEQLANFIAYGLYNAVVSGELSKENALNKIVEMDRSGN